MDRVSFKINGLSKEFVVGPDAVLLDLLREDLDLIGAKQSCDRKGQCGACTVIVNGKAVPSCLTKVKSLEGAEVITVEGLGTPDNPHLIQEAFVLSGAVQCGFCTPGMIMSAKALLDKNPNPTPEEIKKAFQRNLCRCTGYVKIIEAVELAGRLLRGETTLEAETPKESDGVMGQSLPRPSSMAKACGTARFSADYKIKGAAEVAVITSPLPHAKIKSIDASAAEAMPGVLGVVTAKDIKGSNLLRTIVADRPVFCKDTVRVIGDPIAAVVAETIEQARAARDAVKVDLEPLPVLETPAQAMAEGAAQLHAEFPNVCFAHPQKRGDVAAAIKDAAAVIEANFSTQINHQAPLEPEVTVCYWEEEDEDEPKLVVVGRSINIHEHLNALQEALGWNNMAYEEAFTGGQFGIKAEVVSEGIAAAAAIKFRRAVRFVPSLTESFLISCKRHPFDMDVKLAADAEGKITAYFNHFVVDNGAYASIGLYVIFRALWMMSGSYNLPSVDVFSKLVYTNNPWGAAARGAGPPQVNFALECAVDMLAQKLGMDPFDLRMKNLLKPGEAKSTGTVVSEWPIAPLMEAVKPYYDKAKEAAKAGSNGKIKRGVGLGLGSFGIASPGDQAVAAVELEEDGGVTIYAAAADPGEGNDSMLTQLSAQVMGIPMAKVRLRTRSTDDTAASGPAAGSRVTYMLGGAVVNGLTQLKEAMAEVGATTRSQLEAAGKPARYIGTKASSLEGPLDPETGQGPSFESEVHAVQMVEVEVDTESGEVKVVNMVTAVDPGTVINPKNVSGQMEGGADQGVGYALREEYIAGKTTDWRNFHFPTMRDSFPQTVIIKETPRAKGTLGAVGVGEMTMVPTAPAVINAINNATGVWVTHLPATPEKVKAALAGVS